MQNRSQAGKTETVNFTNKGILSYRYTGFYLNFLRNDKEVTFFSNCGKFCLCLISYWIDNINGHLIYQSSFCINKNIKFKF